MQGRQKQREREEDCESRGLLDDWRQREQILLMGAEKVQAKKNLRELREREVEAKR